MMQPSNRNFEKHNRGAAVYQNKIKREEEMAQSLDDSIDLDCLAGLISDDDDQCDSK